MVINKYINRPILLIMGIALTFSRCTEKFNCDRTVYTFQINIEAFPDKDSIHIGDTVWLTVNTKAQFKDTISGKEIDYGGAENLGPAISYLKLIGGNFSNPGVLPAANSFNNILITGKLTSNLKADQFRGFLFQGDSGTYKFRLGIVPKERGIFVISPGNAANVYRKNDKCTKASFMITFKNTDQHLYLYEQSRPGYIPSEYEKTHMYCFKVY